ncbi:MAG TPA: hypothetical protein VMF68_07330 [Spirochaetia bacterium]|nr:hypothetical protein [Spirochaetia bacterium]
MAIDAISPVMSAAPLSTVSRPQQTTPSAQQALAQENDAKRIAQSTSGASPAALARPEENAGPTSVGTRSPVAATPDTEGSLRESQAQLARASEGPQTTSTARAVSEAYQAQASAMQNLSQQQRGNGTEAGQGSQGVNILA